MCLLELLYIGVFILSLVSDWKPKINQSNQINDRENLYCEVAVLHMF